MKNEIKKLSVFKFINILRERWRRFKNASSAPIKEEYPVNTLARKLHPKIQYALVQNVVDHNSDTRTYVLIPNQKMGTEEFAYFSAGQYISISLEIDGKKTTRAYSLSSSPRESLAGQYEITVKKVNDGLVSQFIFENWKEGTEVEISAPLGNFEYVGLRDSKNVIGVAGGSGITPFLSMAKAIAQGDEDFNLIILYGCRNNSSILFKKEFDELQSLSDKIKVVYVLSDEKNPDFEYGFIDSKIIKKYAPSENYSIFICGPQSMYTYLDKELSKLSLEKKYIRREMFGEIHDIKTQSGFSENYEDLSSVERVKKEEIGDRGDLSEKTSFPDKLENQSDESQIKITLTTHGITKSVYGDKKDTILQILEKNGIVIPTQCRSGECGWCHTLLKSGKVFIPENLDFRRKADEIYGFIHPCCSFALTDVELEN